MKDFEADDLEEQVLKEERERIRPLVADLLSRVDSLVWNKVPSEAPSLMEKIEEVFADLQKELNKT